MAKDQAQVRADAAIATGRERWARRFEAAIDEDRVRDADYTALSGMTVDPVYGPAPGDVVQDFERIGWPGEFPFTRGLHPTGYRGKPWTIRQFAGFGNADDTNRRYKMILAEGGHGLSVAFDMPTLMGRDSDDPRSLGEVGHCGVAIDSAADMDVLFGDLMAYCAAEIPRYKPLSVSGYHIREAGATAAQELAFTLADGFAYVEL